jgi:hypothetical protein
MVIVWCAHLATAQAQEPRLEPATEPGVVEERIRDEVKERTQPEQEEPQVREILLEGNTALPTSLFAPVLEGFRARDMTVSDLKLLTLSTARPSSSPSRSGNLPARYPQEVADTSCGKLVQYGLCTVM